MSKLNGRGAASPTPVAPTSAADWRKRYEIGELTELPSGNVARLRPMSLDTLIRLNRIPNVLLGLVAVDLVGKQEGDEQSAEETSQEMIRLMDTLTETMFMEPRVVESDPAVDEISLDMVALVDKQFLLERVLDGSHQLRSFRPQPQSDVAVVPPHSDDGGITEPAVGADRVGD